MSRVAGQMRRVLIGTLFILASLAGCLGDADPPAAGQGNAGDILPVREADPSTGPVVRSEPASSPTTGEPGPAAGTAQASAGAPTLRPGELLRWQGTCPCERLPFDLEADGWDGWLEVRVQWDGTATSGFGMRVDGPSGSQEGRRGFDDRLARWFAPSSGRHEVALQGAGDFEATARLGTTAVPTTGPLLPNLVELVIEGPRIGMCDDVERTEQGATKCMRFGNGVGNPGHGPVQIRLTVDQGLMALAPLDGRFAQEVRQAEGDLASHPVGPAEFHVSHSHWHYDGLALFELFTIDEATGLRGALASSHHKSGFCFLDWGEMEEPVTVPSEQERAESDCLIPGTTGSWTNGISKGWYDFYWSDLTDQYVDVAGLADGVYELVASADPLGTLDELDETDNQSSVLIRLAGDTVEVLEERAHYRVQEKDDE